MINPASSAGPEGDGSKSLAKESKVGLAVSFLLTVAAMSALEWLTNLDTSKWTGWTATVVAAAASTLAGLLASWLKGNR